MKFHVTYFATKIKQHWVDSSLNCVQQLNFIETKIPRPVRFTVTLCLTETEKTLPITGQYAIGFKIYKDSRVAEWRKIFCILKYMKYGG